MGPNMSSEASAATGPLGYAQPDTGVASSAPRASARSMNAAMAVRWPWLARYASPSYCGPFSPKADNGVGTGERSEEHTSELQSLMRISYAVFCLKKKNSNTTMPSTHITYSHKRHTHI